MAEGTSKALEAFVNAQSYVSTLMSYIYQTEALLESGVDVSNQHKLELTTRAQGIISRMKDEVQQLMRHFIVSESKLRCGGDVTPVKRKSQASTLDSPATKMSNVSPSQYKGKQKILNKVTPDVGGSRHSQGSSYKGSSLVSFSPIPLSSTPKESGALSISFSPAVNTSEAGDTEKSLSSEEVRSIISNVKEGERVCEICRKEFGYTASLKRHLVIHDPKRPKVDCPYCFRELAKRDVVLDHLRRLHPEGVILSCLAEGCKRFFVKIDRLKDHVRSHSICSSCGLVLMGQTALVMHKSRNCPGVSHRKQWPCLKESCPYLGSSWENLIDHYVDSHLSFCYTCKVSFTEREPYNVHCKMLHNGSSPYTCPTCSETFEKVEAFRAHLLTKQNKRLICRPFRCQTCFKGFFVYGDMLKHIEYDHNRGSTISEPQSDKPTNGSEPSVANVAETRPIINLDSEDNLDYEFKSITTIMESDEHTEEPFQRVTDMSSANELSLDNPSLNIEEERKD